MTTDNFFIRGDLPSKMSAAHRICAEKLINQLKEREEMILDFDALQSSVDPMLDSALLPANGEDGQEEKFDYEQFLNIYFNTTDIMPSLQIFKLRGYGKTRPVPSKFLLMEGIKQLYSLTELDLSENNLSKEDLQLWSLVGLKTLKLDKTQLTQVPPSIGRLRKLRHLSLSNNSLNSLPVTLGFCNSLTYLDLSKNKFHTLPGVLLKLENLQDLKRLDNDLQKRFDGYGTWPHIQSQTITQRSSNNPDSLQALTCRTIMTTHVDYWAEENLPPLHCKILDKFATQYQYCENCHQSDCSKMFEVKVMFLKFVGLTDVPISIYSCQNCKDILINRFKIQQTDLREQIEEDYEREMREAERTFILENPDYKPPVRTRRQQQHRRRRRKCSIM